MSTPKDNEMMRSLRMCTLAVVGALALGAAAAGSASAQEVKIESGASPSWLTATDTNWKMSVEGITLECGHVGFDSVGAVSMPTDKLSLTPKFAPCHWLGPFVTHVEDNGCRFDFDLKDEHHESSFTSGVYLNCGPEGKGTLTMTVTFSGTKLCTMTFGTQTATGNLTVVDSGSTLTLSGSVSGMTFVSTGSFCFPAGQYHNAVMSFNTVLSAYSNSGHTQQTPLGIKTFP